MLHFSNISLAINHIYITFLFVTGQVVGSHIIRKIFKHFSVICPCIFLLKMAGTRSICTFFFFKFLTFLGGILTIFYLPFHNMAGCGCTCFKKIFRTFFWKFDLFLPSSTQHGRLWALTSRPTRSEAGWGLGMVTGTVRVEVRSLLRNWQRKSIILLPLIVQVSDNAE